MAEAATIAQYRMALLGASRSHRRYPPEAVGAGWQGRVEVRLEFDATAGLSRAEVVRSSGHPVLDDAAIAMLRDGYRSAPVPAGLRDRAFAVEVPVLFELP